jgi:hypothetical protein
MKNRPVTACGIYNEIHSSRVGRGRSAGGGNKGVCVTLSNEELPRAEMAPLLPSGADRVSGPWEDGGGIPPKVDGWFALNKDNRFFAEEHSMLGI